MSKNKNGKKRDMISSPQFIISAAKQFIRSTGNLLDQASDKHSFSYYCNNIVDTEYFRQYTTLLSASGNADSLINVGAISLDGLYVGYSTWPQYSGLLPHFEAPTDTGVNTVNVNSLNPFNPSNMFGTGVNNTGLVDSGTYNPSGWAEGGHNILAAMTASRIADTGSLESGVHSTSNYFDADFYYRKKTELLDIRSVAHRAPLILSGPGYDVDGNPVPTGADGGMHPQAYSNPSLWKTGPLDVRWDQSRAVWSAGSTTKVFLSKVTNTYNPSNFSYEVERSSSRDQFSRVGPTIRRDFNAADPIYDPEQIAYDADENNVGAYEKLDYTGIEFPHYEAFILRQTNDDVGPSYYNIWTEDCSDCGHTSNPCPSGVSTQNGDASAGKKILIENPLKQSLEAGDLCFTVKTGRTKNVNTGSFIGGSGVGASGYVSTNSSGIASFVISNSGSGYIYGGFALISSGICAGVTPSFTGGMLSSAVIVPASGLPKNKTYQVSVYPLNSTAETEALDVHWIMQAEFKTTQVATYVGCDGGVLQTCSRKIQTQGMVSCEYCGTSTALINSF
jgi:hypothetical protein